MTRKILVCVFALLLCLNLGCSSASIKAFQDAAALQDDLRAKYEWQGVSVIISNGFALGISFLNSPFNQLDKTAQEAKAREIATYAKQNYGSIDQISQIIVGFTRYEKLYGIIDFTNSLDTYFFDVNELAAPPLSELLGEEYKTVFVVKASNTGIATELFSAIGAAGIFFGIALVAASIYFARKRKENAIYLGALFGAGGVLFGNMFLLFGTLFGTLLSAGQNKYLTAYNQQQYQIVEGPVRVISEEPRSGHADGDRVQIGGKTFEISYFVMTPAYHQTIAYGGILRNGVDARVYYVGDDIVRIDVKKP